MKTTETVVLIRIKMRKFAETKGIFDIIFIAFFSITMSSFATKDHIRSLQYLDQRANGIFMTYFSWTHSPGLRDFKRDYTALWLMDYILPYKSFFQTKSYYHFAAL